MILLFSCPENDFVIKRSACGNALGNPSDQSLNLDQYVEDLDKVVDLINHKYKPDSVYLLGWSWGGLLSKAYLTDSSRQGKIAGYIETGDSHHLKSDMELSSEWIVSTARERLEAGGDPSLQTIIDRHTPHRPVTTVDDFWEQSEDVDTLGGYFVGTTKGEVYPGYYALGDILASPLGLVNELQNASHVVDVLVPRILAMEPLDYSPITIPVFFLWGEQDGILPVTVARRALDDIGTAEADKALIVIDDTAHSSPLEKPREFSTALLEFIRR